MRAALLALAMAAAMLAAGPARAAAKESGAKRVLLLLSENGGIEWERRVESRFRSVCRREATQPVVIYSEYLDLGRYKGPAYREMMADLLLAKYPPGSIDLVVCSGSMSVLFYMRFNERLFLGVPMVFAAQEQRVIYKALTMWNMTGVFRNEDVDGTMRIALDLFPETRRVYLVSGKTAGEMMLAYSVRGKLAPFSDRVEIIDWDDLALDELFESAATLPEHSIILFLGMSRDAEGRNLVPRDVLDSLVDRADAPVFVLYDTDLIGNEGGLGGAIVHARQQG